MTYFFFFPLIITCIKLKYLLKNKNYFIYLLWLFPFYIKSKIKKKNYIKRTKIEKKTYKKKILYNNNYSVLKFFFYDFFSLYKNYLFIVYIKKNNK